MRSAEKPKFATADSRGSAEAFGDDAARRSPRVPWLLAVGAPLAAAGALLVVRDVWAVFLVYQVTFCLLLPALLSLLVYRIGWRGHRRLLGLTRMSGRSAGASAAASGLLAVATTAIVALFLALTAEVSHPADRVREAMIWWGIVPVEWPWVLTFMLIVHAPAEELFWRGYLFGRLVPAVSPAAPANGRRIWPGAPAAAVMAGLALLYASYHGVTLAKLVPSTALAVLMFVTIWLAGCLWNWLRWRFASVWPPLLAHTGAVAAYVAFVPSM